jgi:hypothetical protein
VKVDRVSQIFSSTHDLSCVMRELARAAGRYTQPAFLSSEHSVTGDLAIAAIGLTIQLAIDAAGRDPAEMRTLERDLYAALEERRA